MRRLVGDSDAVGMEMSGAMVNQSIGAPRFYSCSAV
jgi:hypothetical protein